MPHHSFPVRMNGTPDATLQLLTTLSTKEAGDNVLVMFGQILHLEQQHLSVLHFSHLL
jgi:hypothetical protein